ncbi:MAG: dicarboxylate/amino acid:cation symporter [Opitutaceae bacterium]|nr:dicarboxylate/amino acid:cation symporter [Opitutaceae bacterium]
MTSPAKNKLTRNIIIGMFLGFLIGGLLNLWNTNSVIDRYLIGGLFYVGGSIFLASLKLLVVPLVFVSLVCGTTALDDVRKLGRVGLKTVFLYLGTTAIAISIALTAAVVFQPGVGFELSTNEGFSPKEAPPLSEVIIGLFPTNPVKAMAEGNMLQIIVCSILFGVALVISGDAGKRVGAVFNDLNEIIMKLVFILMQIAPYGVFCLIAKTFATEGFAAIKPLALYFFLVFGVLIFHALCTYASLLKVFSGLSPLRFFRKIRRAQLFAFSTASSGATIPVTLDVVENRIGVKNSIASFTIPLGATLNMDGTAIMQGVAAVFIAQAYGIEMTFVNYPMVIVTATLASIGTAGVPGVGLIMLAMVLNQVGLPVEGVALIIGVDRLLDMVRTAVNITGDAVVSCIVSKSEGQFDQSVFDRD